MGTSKSYKPTSKSNPSLGTLSAYISRISRNPTPSNHQLLKVINKFIDHAGGKQKIIKGQSAVHGKAGVKTAGRIGSFFSDAYQKGIEKTLLDAGIGVLEGKTIKEVIDFLTTYLTEESVTLDDTAARTATRQILEDITKNVDDIDELEQFLNSKDNLYLDEVLVKYFGIYLYESISTRFYEKILNEKPSSYDSFFRRIKQFVIENTKNFHRRNNITKIDWNGKEGDDMNIQLVETHRSDM